MLKVILSVLSASQFSQSMSKETFSAHFFDDFTQVIMQEASRSDNFVSFKISFNFHYDLNEMCDNLKTSTVPNLQ